MTAALCVRMLTAAATVRLDVLRPRASSETAYECLRDTVDPRGPKGMK